MRISKKTKEEYKAIKWKQGFKPVEGGWLERGFMHTIQQMRSWPQWMKDEANRRKYEHDHTT